MIRAYVSEQAFGLNVNISIVHHHNDDGTGQVDILRIADTGAYCTWEEVEPGTQVKPTFNLGHLEARALLDALHTHYSGVEDTRALRRDYDNERDRVDKLTDSLTSIAKALASVDA
jgi:hypothetical protein